MRKIALSEIQPLEFDIMSRLIDFMEKNSIAYFTCGGTTLGSVRHGGFIPWDDDIDLLVPRKDYDRLLALTDKKLIDGFIRLKKPGDPNYIYPFSKACNENTVIYEQNVSDQKYAVGIFVDIFPLDNFYDSKWKNFILLLRARLLKSMIESGSGQINLSKKGSMQYYVKQILRGLQKPFTLIWTPEKSTVRLDSLGRKMQRHSSNHTGNLMWGAHWHDYYPKSLFDSATEGTFETRKVNNPAGYDQYLTIMYGDYMTLPPEDQRVMHGFEAYYKDDTKE